MRIEVDTHTHSVLSGHAHSTIIENAAAAKRKGLKGFVMSEHGPRMQAAPPEFNIGTYAYLPKYIEGVRAYPGIESNIIDFKGSIDIREKYLKRLEYAIAGLHDVVIDPGTKKENTDATIGALNNVYVDVIAHPDNPAYELDYEAVVREAARLGKLLEINDHSFEYRKGSIHNAHVIAELCEKHGVRVAVSSDAHSAFGMGMFDTAISFIKEIGFPESLVVNLAIERFESYLEERRRRIDGA